MLQLCLPTWAHLKLPKCAVYWLFEAPNSLKTVWTLNLQNFGMVIFCSNTVSRTTCTFIFPHKTRFYCCELYRVLKQARSSKRTGQISVWEFKLWLYYWTLFSILSSLLTHLWSSNSFFYVVWTIQNSLIWFQRIQTSSTIPLGAHKKKGWF